MDDIRKLSNEEEEEKDDDRRYGLLQEHLSLLTPTHPTTALRCAYALVSFRNTPVKARKRIQQVAFDAWHASLLDILLLESDDTSSRQRLAGKILTNLITDNPVTALQLMSTSVQLEPGRAKRNWVDLILHTRHDRVALAALLACLHNCIVQEQPHQLVLQAITQQHPAATPMLFFATLLRQLVSSSSKELKRDSASDWILWIVTQFPLAVVYNTITSSSTTTITVPEHVVLLLLYRMALQEDCIPQLRDEDSAFLVHLFLSLEPLAATDMTQQHDAVYHLVVEILCEDLLASSNDTTSDTAGAISPPPPRQNDPKTETWWGPQVLPVVLRRMSDCIDTWNASHAVIRQRRTLSADTQRWMVNCVRLVGLLCHTSPLHQDLLRTTLIPPAPPMTTTASTTTTTSPTTQQQQQQQQRSGLHILLSMTSIAPACFTAREWAIVAIRYALAACPANQAAVAALQAQDAVQSADCDSMGIRVEMNAQGNVSVKPVVDDNDDDNGEDHHPQTPPPPDGGGSVTEE